MTSIKTTNYIQEYYNGIKNGVYVVSKKVRKQYEKLNYLLEHPEENYIETFDGTKEYFEYDHEKATKPIKFIEQFCVHVKGEFAGELIKLELWQKAMISSLYGFVSVNTGYRRFRRLHLYIARKNGKTIIAAALMIYELLLGKEIGPEIYSGATKMDQAKIAWDMARTMIQRNPVLEKRIRITIQGIYTKPFSDGYYKPICKESKKLDGLNAHFSHIDELHAITDSNIIDVMWDSSKARKQPIELITTTMGTVRQSTFDEVYEFDSNVLDGLWTDDRLLVFCYELDQESEWDKIEMAYKANPNLGISLSITDFYEEIQKAKSDIKKKTNFLCKSCNIRQSEALSWLTFEELNNEEVIDTSQFKSPIVIGGFDLAKTGDLTGFTTLLFDTKNKKIIAETMYWVTQKYVDQAEKVPFKIWVQQGYARISGIDRIDYHDIIEYVQDKVFNHNYVYNGIGYDPWSASYLINDFEAMGFAKNYVLKEVRQGAKTLSIPMQEMESDIKSRIFCYQNNPITKWCLTNTEVLIDENENIRPAKSKYERKIDGTLTILDAYTLYIENKDYYLNGGE